MTSRNEEGPSLAREIVGLVALLVNLMGALGAGVLVMLRLVLWIPETAKEAGLVADVTTGVVFVGVALSAAIALAVMLAVLYLGSALFAAVEASLTNTG